MRTSHLLIKFIITWSALNENFSSLTMSIEIRKTPLTRTSNCLIKSNFEGENNENVSLYFVFWRKNCNAEAQRSARLSILLPRDRSRLVSVSEHCLYPSLSLSLNQQEFQSFNIGLKIETEFSEPQFHSRKLRLTNKSLSLENWGLGLEARDYVS